MIKGSAEVKKGIKYLGGDKFELTLTNVSTNDVMDLLAVNGTRIAYVFNGAMETRGEVREEPQNGKLYNVVNGVVEVPPANTEDEEENEQPIEEDEMGCPCPTCTHLTGEPDDADPNKMVNVCEMDRFDGCFKCKGEGCPGGIICPEYDPIADLGADEGEPEEPKQDCQKCVFKDATECPFPSGLEEGTICSEYELWKFAPAQDSTPADCPQKEKSCETCTWNGETECPYPDRNESCVMFKSIEDVDA